LKKDAIGWGDFRNEERGTGNRARVDFGGVNMLEAIWFLLQKTKVSGVTDGAEVAKVTEAEKGTMPQFTESTFLTTFKIQHSNC
jgi:hypothetical protein